MIEHDVVEVERDGPRMVGRLMNALVFCFICYDCNIFATDMHRRDAEDMMDNHRCEDTL